MSLDPTSLASIVIERLRRKLKEANQSRGNTLALIHGDGGQYIQAHGWKKAEEDAVQVWCKLKNDLADAQARIAELEGALRFGKAVINAAVHQSNTEQFVYGPDGKYICNTGEGATRFYALYKALSSGGKEAPRWMGPAEYNARKEAGDLSPEGTYYTGERQEADHEG